MNIRITKTNPAAIIPTYATDGSGCFDLYACANQRAYDFMTVDTGLAFELPPGYLMRIESRSGLALREHVKAFPGIVDSDYRGSVRVLLYQFAPTDEPISIKAGDRIAQAWIVQSERVTFSEVVALSETGRGAGGFGSSGK